MGKEQSTKKQDEPATNTETGSRTNRLTGNGSKKVACLRPRKWRASGRPRKEDEKNAERRCQAQERYTTGKSTQHRGSGPWPKSTGGEQEKNHHSLREEVDAGSVHPGTREQSTAPRGKQ